MKKEEREEKVAKDDAVKKETVIQKEEKEVIEKVNKDKAAMRAKIIAMFKSRRASIMAQRKKFWAIKLRNKREAEAKMAAAKAHADAIKAAAAKLLARRSKSAGQTPSS